MTISRIVVTLQPTFDGGTQVKLDKATANFPQGQLAAPFVCPTPTTTTWAVPNAVMQHGRDLRQALAQHPAIAQMLQMLALAPPATVTPIYFYLQAPEAEQLYWEALYDDAQGIFLALDLRWPIGRIADALATQPAQTFYKFDGRLRMAVVLSALDAPAAVEWQNLRLAIDAVRAQGLPVDVLLLVGEEALHDDIEAELATGALSGVTVKLLEATVDKLESALDEFQPHLLHFFCHGAVNHGISRLEVATALDWASGAEVSSLVLPVEQLIALPSMRQVWLVVLNCCQGGAATDQLHSMAHALVARGAPAVVGMLEPIAATDAHRFCAGFYPALLREISQALGQSNAASPVPIEWSLPLRAARIQLHAGVDPKNERTWALPVLYARPELFQVVRADKQAAAPGQSMPGTPKGVASLQAMLQRAQEVADFLRTLPVDAPGAIRQRALALLDEDPAVPPDLRPDAFGKFA
ncbi:MAG: CHAT domain-containing protein [Caldilineaceae bacterium]|jgi:hypothetical protein|nr:CHAT domain-containing protein [Caldilineaceae bacterium]